MIRASLYLDIKQIIYFGSKDSFLFHPSGQGTDPGADFCITQIELFGNSLEFRTRHPPCKIDMENGFARVSSWYVALHSVDVKVKTWPNF
jgi:hypothetical protein